MNEGGLFIIVIGVLVTIIVISENEFVQAGSPEAEDLFNDGYNLLEQERYEEAITYFDKVLAIDPNDIDALVNKGNSLDELDKHEEAINHYDKVLAIDPDDTDALGNKGGGLNDLGKYHEAITYIDKVLAIDPNDIVSLPLRRIIGFN